MADTFSSVLKGLIESKFGGVLRAFIRAAEPSDREDSGTGYASKVLAGIRPAPLDRIDAWADALDLKGDARETFLDLAALTHLPKGVRTRFERLYAEHRDLMKLAADLKKADGGAPGRRAK